MGTIKTKLTRLLKSSFKGADVELEVAAPARKVGGFLIWDGFEGKEQIDRQTELWDLLRSRLSREEQLQITAVLTLTPNEVAVMREG